MNAKALFFFVVALACGGGAAIFANNWLKEQVGEVEQAEGVDTTPVVVATSEIDYGQPIEDIHIKVVRWPTENVPPTSLASAEEAIGKLANQRILTGEPILESRVVEKLAGSTLSSMIAPNKRAITLRVNDVVGVAGFLLPGNHVDVLGTRLDSNRRAQSRTVLQNLKVLAVDQKASPDKDEPLVVRAVTLEADLDESLELVKATQEGEIQLVLRNPEDIAERIYAPPVAAAPKRRSTRTVAPTVRIIRGISVNDSSLKN